MIVRLRLAWTVFALVVVTIVLVPYQAFAHWTRLVDPTRAPRWWYRAAARVLRLRIHVGGRLEGNRPLLLVSNHISWTDVIVLGALFRGSFIAKSELDGWPVVGALSKLQGTVLVDRQNKSTAGNQVGALSASLAGGRAMVLFAEGTTSDGTSILPFKTTLFAAARAAIRDAGASEVLIQPVSIAYTRLGGLPMGRRQRGLVAWTGDEDLLPHLTGLLRLPPLDVEVRWGEAIRYTADSDRKAVARQAERQVRAMFAASIAHPALSRERRLVEAEAESR